MNKEKNETVLEELEDEELESATGGFTYENKGGGPKLKSGDRVLSKEPIEKEVKLGD